MELTEVEVGYSTDGYVLHITVPGGELSALVARELAAAVEAAREVRSIRVVVLRSAGADFCTGIAPDVDVFELRPDPASAVASLRPPVIAALVGSCQGEGLEIALAADIRIAGPAATFAMDHILQGRMPAWGGSQRLGRTVLPATAVRLALLGTEIDAEEAKRLGLLYDVFDDLDAAATELTDTLVSRGPLALELAKEAVHRGSELPLRDGLRLEGDLNHQLAASEDRAEGLAAFFEKRPPDFSGR